MDTFTRRDTIRMLSLGSVGAIFGQAWTPFQNSSQIISSNIPMEAKKRSQELTSSEITAFTFNARNGWVVVNKNREFAHKNIAASCLKKLTSLLNQGHQIKCIAFPPKGAESWVITTDRTVAYANIPSSLSQVLDRFKSSGTRVNQVVFQPRRDNNRWLVITDKEFKAQNIPDECMQVIHNLQQPPRPNTEAPRKIHHVTISPKGGWAVFADDYFFSRNMPSDCLRLLNAMRGKRKMVDIVTFSTEGWSVVSNRHFERPPTDQIRSFERKVKGGGIWSRMKKSKVPGVSVSVVLNNKVAWSCGYGHLKAGGVHAAHHNSIYQVGSLSQVFSTIGAFRLANKNRVDLDADLREGLLKWTIPVKAPLKLTEEQKPTLRNLLAHRGGFGIKGLAGYSPGLPLPSLMDLLNGTGKARNPKLQIEFAPDLQYRQSAGGFILLDKLIKDLTNQEAADWLNDNVLQPLGMKNSSFKIDVDDKYISDYNVATGHNPRGRALYGDRNRYPETSAYGLHTTAEDIAQMLIMVNQGGDFNYSKFLPIEAIEEMLTPIHYQEKRTRGIGFHVTDFTQVVESGKNFKYWNAGANAGFRALFMGFPMQKGGVVVLSNGNATDGPRFCYDVANTIATVYGLGAKA